MNKVLKKVIANFFDPLRFVANSLSIEQSMPIQVQANLEREFVYNTEHAQELGLPLGFDISDSPLQYHRISHV